MPKNRHTIAKLSLNVISLPLLLSGSVLWNNHKDHGSNPTRNDFHRHFFRQLFSCFFSILIAFSIQKLFEWFLLKYLEFSYHLLRRFSAGGINNWLNFTCLNIARTIVKFGNHSEVQYIDIRVFYDLKLKYLVWN